MKFAIYDYPLLPVYWYQAKQTKKSMVRLPEPDGERTGTLLLDACRQQICRLMILGDSATAGVGVAHQQTALSGRLMHHLGNQHHAKRLQRIEWQLHATTGHTSFDILKRLYTLPASPIDIAIVSIGVNDVLKNTPITRWQQQLQAIITLLTRKFAVKQVLFTSVPPMQMMPHLPTPLNRLLGNQAHKLDQSLQQICQQHKMACHLPIDFAKIDLPRHQLFAKDGFHPSAVTYDIWAKAISKQLDILLGRLPSAQ